jgi:hypothetical protein
MGARPQRAGDGGLDRWNRSSAILPPLERNYGSVGAFVKALGRWGGGTLPSGIPMGAWLRGTGRRWPLGLPKPTGPTRPER